MKQTALAVLLEERGQSIADLTREAGLNYTRVWRAVAGYGCSRTLAGILAAELGVQVHEIYPATVLPESPVAVAP